MTEAAEKAGVINMVNLTYRNVAPLQKARGPGHGRGNRHDPPCRSVIPAKAGESPSLGRLEDGKPVAVAPVEEAWFNGHAGDVGITYWISPAMAPVSTLIMCSAACAPLTRHRETGSESMSGCQRFLHNGSRFFERGAGRSPFQPLGDRPSQRTEAASLRRKGDRSKSGIPPRGLGCTAARRRCGNCHMA